MKALQSSAATAVQHNTRLYRDEINPINLVRLNQQFNALWHCVSSNSFKIKQLLSAIRQLPEFRNAGATVRLDDDCWPAEFRPDTNELLLHRDLLTYAGQNPQAKLYGLTEIFDRLIYAQMHWQHQEPGSPGILPASGVADLPALLAIKAKKQNLFRAAMSTGHGQGESPAAQPILVDPMTAWLLASPRYGLESECAKAFEQSVMQIFSGD